MSDKNNEIQDINSIFKGFKNTSDKSENKLRRLNSFVLSLDSLVLSSTPGIKKSYKEFKESHKTELEELKTTYTNTMQEEKKLEEFTDTGGRPYHMAKLSLDGIHKPLEIDEEESFFKECGGFLKEFCQPKHIIDEIVETETSYIDGLKNYKNKDNNTVQTFIKTTYQKVNTASSVFINNLTTLKGAKGDIISKDSIRKIIVSLNNYLEEAQKLYPDIVSDYRKMLDSSHGGSDQVAITPVQRVPRIKLFCEDLQKKNIYPELAEELSSLSKKAKKCGMTINSKLKSEEEKQGGLPSVDWEIYDEKSNNEVTKRRHTVSVVNSNKDDNKHARQRSNTMPIKQNNTEIKYYLRKQRRT